MKSDCGTGESPPDHNSQRQSWVYRLWWNHRPSCQETMALVSQHLDQNLSWPQRLPLYLHLLGCIYCRRFFQQSKLLGHWVRQFASEEKVMVLSTRLNPSARERIARDLKNRPRV